MVVSKSASAQKFKTMSLTMVDQYFLKAQDEYPYNLEAFLENINYVSNYTDEHAGVAYLMGRMHMDQFSNFTLAEEYFQTALSLENCSIYVYSTYTDLLLQLRDYDKAIKLIEYALGVPGMIQPMMIHKKAKAYEAKEEYTEALKCIKQCIRLSTNGEELSYLKDEKARIKEKKKLLQPTKKKSNVKGKSNKTQGKSKSDKKPVKKK